MYEMSTEIYMWWEEETRCGNECWKATFSHRNMDTPCEHRGDLYGLESRHLDSRYRDSSEDPSTMPSGLACGCRQDDHWHPNLPRNRCRCCGHCNDGHELPAPIPDDTDIHSRPSWCNSGNRYRGNHGLNDTPPIRLPWNPELLGKHPTPILVVWTISVTFAPC